PVTTSGAVAGLVRKSSAQLGAPAPDLERAGVISSTSFLARQNQTGARIDFWPERLGALSDLRFFPGEAVFREQFLDMQAFFRRAKIGSSEPHVSIALERLHTNGAFGQFLHAAMWN